MRSRDEILGSLRVLHGSTYESATLEVLLDIRELLTEQTESLDAIQVEIRRVGGDYTDR